MQLIDLFLLDDFAKSSRVVNQELREKVVFEFTQLDIVDRLSNAHCDELLIDFFLISYKKGRGKNVAALLLPSVSYIPTYM